MIVEPESVGLSKTRLQRISKHLDERYVKAVRYATKAARRERPKMVLIAELEGRPVGFVMALPNINEILIDIKKGRLFPGGIFKLLFLKSRIKGIRVTTIGVVPDCQPLGIGSLLYFRLMESFLKSRYQKVEFSWVMEDNHRVKKMALAIGARPYKTYRMYQNSPPTT